MIDKDYVDPSEWAEFLKENELPQNTPLPPSSLLQDLPHKLWENAFRVWAQAQKPVNPK